ncbi:MAG: pimeloyl-ACP methyl ester esterase BioH [Aliiglaciecola sp.]
MNTPLFTESRGQGPELVMLHGWGLNSGVWEPISHYLEQHFRITMIDLPGFGRNAANMPKDYTLESIASMVLAVMPDKCSLLGWSLGGLVAQEIAIEHCERLDRLVLVASTPKFSQSEDWPGIGKVVLETFERQLEQDFSKTLDRFMAIQAMGSESARDDIKQIKAHIQHFPIPDNRALQAGLAILAQSDLRHRLKDITCPVNCLYGRLDSLVPHKAIERIQSLYTDAQHHVFAHASHAPFISHPQLFMQSIAQIFNIEYQGEEPY